MHLDYRLSEDWDENSTDLAAADETDLRYYAATGDIIFRKDQTDLSARWGWIPLIDFALALREIAEALAVTEGSETFEFTESEATLRFDRRGPGNDRSAGVTRRERSPSRSRHSWNRSGILRNGWTRSCWPSGRSSDRIRSIRLSSFPD